MSADDHGSASTYANHGCRCEPCRKAHTEQLLRRRAERDPADAPEHGTHAIYTNWNCRCDPCRLAHNARIRAAARRRRQREKAEAS